MTSQKFFNNKYGMVIASDSISTVAFNKTYSGACKVFELKKNPACGLMISGSSEFGGIPFEILVSKFKKSTDLTNLDSIREIKKEFLDYMGKNTPKVNLNDYVDDNISQFKKQLKGYVDKMSEKEFWEYLENSKKSEVFEFLMDYYKYDSIFSDIIPDFVSDNDYDLVNELFWMQFSEILSFMESVIFICGFNKNQNFGSFEEFSVILNIDGKIHGNDLDSIENCSKPIIKEFAQNEGSDAFLHGVDWNFESSLIDYHERITECNLDEFLNMAALNLDLDNELLDDLKKEADEFKLIQKNLNSFVIFINSMKKAFENQILEGVSLMPISLLCIFAEILIKNTYLRQEASPKMVTAGGDINIASLTIKHGFVWEKGRKIFRNY